MAARPTPSPTVSSAAEPSPSSSSADNTAVSSPNKSDNESPDGSSVKIKEGTVVEFDKKPAALEPRRTSFANVTPVDAAPVADQTEAKTTFEEDQTTAITLTGSSPGNYVSFLEPPSESTTIDNQLHDTASEFDFGTSTLNAEALLSLPNVDTPDAATATSAARSSTFAELNLFSSFAPALVAGGDGYFGSSLEFESANNNYNSSSSMYTAPTGEMFPPFQTLPHHREPDLYPLPSFLQAHLDETYAASSMFPQGVDSNVFFQVTAFRQLPNGTSQPIGPSSIYPAAGGAVATTAVGGSDDVSIDSNKENIDPTAATFKPRKKSSTMLTKKPKLRRPPPLLPMRKRNYESVEDDSSSASSSLVPKKRPPLARHNMNRKESERITCKCSKSKCLKVGC